LAANSILTDKISYFRFWNNTTKCHSLVLTIMDRTHVHCTVSWFSARSSLVFCL
jgi:hypothetical protein